ncbi:class I SAM-dependent methyltransferase [Streptomyces millisiae]|uniref:Methyltransferase domain-containing protein n=1 Tax=Streptomyces millisiae TaxID=3075542 RepID=A0ABU2LP14_9ACTN|nr:methyltransferase domain-containing protein [Streptomyces sp. DSM 44918]MDT0319335.1 methyltransferase domain-containing protein [Streptomyces sp. DSM 44918]
MATTPTSPSTPSGTGGTTLFLAEALRGFRTTGAIAPSGRRLAAALAAPLRERGAGAWNVLEVGGGTGAVTRELMPLLGAGSRLDVVEANARFAARLRELTAHEAERVQVHHTFVEDLDTGRSYDVIVSGLPFTNFEPEQVDAIMSRYLELLHPGGALTYFAYTGTRALRSAVSSRAETARHRAVEEVLAGYQARYDAGYTRVWANLPPARVWRLVAPAES